MSPLCDRDTASALPRSQLGFFDLAAQPLYSALDQVPDLLRMAPYMRRLRRNRAEWAARATSPSSRAPPTPPHNKKRLPQSSSRRPQSHSPSVSVRVVRHSSGPHKAPTPSLVTKVGTVVPVGALPQRCSQEATPTRHSHVVEVAAC